MMTNTICRQKQGSVTVLKDQTPDHDVQKYGKNKALRLISTATNVREPCHPHQAQWMAHWMRSSSRSMSQDHESIPTSDGRNRIHLMRQGNLLDKCINSGDAKMLSVNISNTEYKESWRSDSRETDLLPFDLNTIPGAMRSERSSFQIRDCHIKGHNGNLIHTKANLDTQSAHKLRGSSTSTDSGNFDACHFVGSDDLDSEREHFPRFDLNRKVGCTTASKTKYCYGAMAVITDASELSLSPHALKFAPEEHFQAWSLIQGADQCMRPHKLVKRLPSHQFDFMKPYSLTSSHGFHHPARHMTSICSREEGDYLSSIMAQKEHFFFPEHHRFHPCKNSAALVSEMKDVDEIIDQGCGSSSSGPKDGALQPLRDCCHDRKRQIDTSSGLSAGYNDEQGLRKFDDYRNVGNFAKFSIHNAETMRICTSLKSMDGMRGRSENLFTAMSAKKKMAVDLSEVDLMMRDSEVSTEVKGTAFYKMIALPDFPQFHQKEIADQPLPLVNSITGGSKECVQSLEANKMETENESSGKTDTICLDVSPWSPAGEISSSSRKDSLVLSDLRKSQSAEACPISQGISRMETQLPDGNTAHFLLSERAGCPNARGTISRTESISADKVLSNAERPNDLSSSPTLESSLGLERSDRWVKRLRHNASYSQTMSRKRIKFGDASTGGDLHTCFRSVLSCKESSSLPIHMKEQELDDRILSQKSRDCMPSESGKKEGAWIRRWCHPSHRKGPLQSRSAVPVLCEPESLKVVEEKFEGKPFPSIAAMALMGKAFTRFRPCQFRRKGSAVVWNTE